ncbi:hypothetical protein LJC48_06010 [Desulfovibrio sp. OttesenSCG-928-C06]|nr:hypothetical protein [Desulfovibrio sp. OttesenSCG-928-C06]
MSFQFNANRKYFKPIAWKLPAAIALVGVIMLNSSAGPRGMIPILIALLLFGLQFLGRGSALSLDRQCDEAVCGLKEKAIRKFVLDEDEVSEVDPIVLNGYQVEDLWLQPMFRVENGQWRTSNYDGTIILFSAEQLYYYKYSFSLVNNKQNEVAQELFYNDIVSIETRRENCVKYAGSRRHEISYNTFAIKTTGGNEFRTSFKDSDGIERSIAGMKQLVRERKRSDK